METGENEEAAREALNKYTGHLVTNDTFRAFQIANQHHIDMLETEIVTHRILTRYARRTWFEVLAYLLLLTLQIGHLAANSSSVWWNLLFWSANASGSSWGIWLQALGALWQFILLIVLSWRSQVPGWLNDRVAASTFFSVDKHPPFISLEKRHFPK